MTNNTLSDDNTRNTFIITNLLMLLHGMYTRRFAKPTINQLHCIRQLVFGTLPNINQLGLSTAHVS